MVIRQCAKFVLEQRAIELPCLGWTQKEIGEVVGGAGHKSVGLCKSLQVGKYTLSSLMVRASSR